MDQEKYYDNNIAPKLKEIAELCFEKEMSCVFVVEYKTGKTASTTSLKNPCLQIIMVNHCVKTAPNVDAYIIGLKRFAKKENIDTSSSFYLSDRF